LKEIFKIFLENKEMWFVHPKGWHLFPKKMSIVWQNPYSFTISVPWISRVCVRTKCTWQDGWLKLNTNKYWGNTVFVDSMEPSTWTMYMIRCCCVKFYGHILYNGQMSQICRNQNVKSVYSSHIYFVKTIDMNQQP
jgi:hypothetical protein